MDRCRSLPCEHVHDSLLTTFSSLVSTQSFSPFSSARIGRADSDVEEEFQTASEAPFRDRFQGTNIDVAIESVAVSPPFFLVVHSRFPFSNSSTRNRGIVGT